MIQAPLESITTNALILHLQNKELSIATIFTSTSKCSH